MANPAALQRELQIARSNGWLRLFRQASQECGVPVPILLGIASRESRMGQALSPSGKGDGGQAWGLMQIDRNAHPSFTDRHAPTDHAAIITFGACFLRSLRESLPKWKAAIAAYNAGPRNVQRALERDMDVDLVTTDRDYASDVLDRARIFADRLGSDLEPMTAGRGLSDVLTAGGIITAGGWLAWKAGVLEKIRTLWN